MKIFTSYFYQVRFFPRNLIPISTAVWDPKWFHDFKGQDNMFFDSRGVCCGIRANQFAPGPLCSGDCHGREACDFGGGSTKCAFLKKYAEQLAKLDAEKILEMFVGVGSYIKSQSGFDGEPAIALLVHEAPDNLCSERRPIQEYFRANGIEVTEWSRNLI